MSIKRRARRILALAGVRSSSVRHGSVRLPSPRQGVSPIWLVGPPRTGTSTLARRFATQLRRSLLFEPLGPRGTGLRGHTQVRSWFRGTPLADELLAFQREGCAPLAGIVGDRAGFVDQLSGFLDSLYSVWSTDVVIKEVRALPGLDALLEAHEQIGIKPLVVGVEGDPMTACYAFYRLGALAADTGYEGTDVRTLWPYRAHCYRLLGRHPRLTELMPANRFEEALLATLIDQAELLRLEGEGVLEGTAGLWSSARWRSEARVELVDLDLSSPDWRPRWRRDVHFRRLIRACVGAPLRFRAELEVEPPLESKSLAERLRYAVTAWTHHALGGVAAAHGARSQAEASGQ